MIVYQWTSAGLAGIIVFGIFFLIRSYNVHFRYTIWWLVVSLAVFVFGFFPHNWDRIAYFFGVHYPPILIILFGMGMILLKMLTMDIERTRNQMKIRELTQRLGVSEALIEKLEQRLADRER